MDFVKGVWSFCVSAASSVFSPGKRKRDPEQRDKTRADVGYRQKEQIDDTAVKRFKNNTAASQPARTVFGQATPQPAKPFGAFAATPGAGFKFRPPEPAWSRPEKENSRCFQTPRVDFKFEGSEARFPLSRGGENRWPFPRHTTASHNSFTPMSMSGNRALPFQPAKTSTFSDRRPREGYGEAGIAQRFSGLAVQRVDVPLGCLPVQEGLLSPQQREEGVRNLQVMRAQSGLADLRDKSSKHSPIPATNQQAAFAPGGRSGAGRVYGGRGAGDGEVVYAGRTEVGAGRSEEEARARKQEWLRMKELKEQQAERQREEEEGKRERERIREWQHVHKDDLLVKNSLLETDNHHLKAAIEKAEAKAKEMERQAAEDRAARLEAEQRLQELLPPGPPKAKTPLEHAVEGTDMELLAKIKDAITDKELVADEWSLDITREKIMCMEDRVWLNSEVITFFLEWWREEHGGGSQTKMPKEDVEPRCWFANTYFYSKLLDDDNKVYNYSNVKRWTRRIDIFACDKMIIPINDNNVHWFAACIDFRNKRTEVYDSMTGSHRDVHQHLRKWLQDEHQERKKAPLDLAAWSTLSSGDPGVASPRQHNGCDCGMFSLLFCACASIDREFDFKQEDIPLLRSWIVQTIYKLGESKGQIQGGLCTH